MMRERVQKYTDIKSVVMEGHPDAHHVFLQVANQRFCVTPEGCETSEDADWMRDMLCIALEKIVTDEISGGAAVSPRQPQETGHHDAHRRTSNLDRLPEHELARRGRPENQD